jgi:cytochrome c oxidase subunit II
MKRWLTKILLAMLFLLIVFYLGGCFQNSNKTSNTPITNPAPSGSPSVSNGQKIYETSFSDSGKSISYVGGPGMMQGRLVCINCHGPEGHGGTVTIMMQRFEVPNITWNHLTQEDPPFTEETLKVAITQGIDQEGVALNTLMPRWKMVQQDLNDLVAFIKTLK